MKWRYAVDSKYCHIGDKVMKLSKEMIENIETIHRMDKEELYETYGEMIPDSSPENIY
jgi:hypothetical protein